MKHEITFLFCVFASMIYEQTLPQNNSKWWMGIQHWMEGGQKMN